MRTQFTEFTYGYALVDNLRRSGIGEFTAAPILPSLKEEGAEGGGYDVELSLDGIPMLLQFKVPDVITRRSNRIPDGYATPYYRMRLRARRHSQQHQLLSEHEDAGRVVFYVTPLFHRTADLNMYFLADQVWLRSLRIRPNQIGPLPDESEHCVAYDERGSAPAFQSKTRVLNDDFDNESILSFLRQRVPGQSSRSATERGFYELFVDLLEATAQRRTGKTGEDSVAPFSALQPLRAAAYLARVFLDCELFVVGRTNEQRQRNRRSR